MRSWSVFWRFVSIVAILGYGSPETSQARCETTEGSEPGVVVTRKGDAKSLEEAKQPVSKSANSAAEALNVIKRLNGRIKRDKDGNIVEVDLESCQANDDDAACLAGLPTIRKLRLWGADITNKSIGPLKQLPKLVDLTLYNTSIDDAGVAEIKNISTLKSINLRRTTNMTDAALAHLKNMPRLQYLHLLYNNISDAGTLHLAEMKKLKLLDLRGCMRVTDVGLERLRGLTNLKSLKLRCSVTDEGLKNLKGMTKLVALSLEDATVTDEGMIHLAGLTKLESLNLLRTFVSDEGLAHLAGMKHLKDLGLRDVAIDGTDPFLLLDTTTCPFIAIYHRQHGKATLWKLGSVLNAQDAFELPRIIHQTLG